MVIFFRISFLVINRSNPENVTEIISDTASARKTPVIPIIDGSISISGISSIIFRRIASSIE